MTTAVQSIRKRRKLKGLHATWPVPLPITEDTPIYAALVKELGFDPRDSRFSS